MSLFYSFKFRLHLVVVAVIFLRNVPFHEGGRKVEEKSEGENFVMWERRGGWNCCPRKGAELNL